MWITSELNYLKEPLQNRYSVYILGEIEPGDDKRFNHLIQFLPTNDHHTVYLDSPGGDVSAGINIGLRISRGPHWSTSVNSKKVCSSACALIWLAGKIRHVYADGQVGFHAASAAGVVSSDGNAVVGAYLREIGLDFKAIRYVTQTPPEKMEWLTKAKADQYDITAFFLLAAASTPVSNPLAQFHAKPQLDIPTLSPTPTLPLTPISPKPVKTLTVKERLNQIFGPGGFIP